MKQNVRDEKPGPDKSRDVVGFKWILVAIEISAYGLHWQFFFALLRRQCHAASLRCEQFV
jgi:hypothetical protein